MSQEPIWDSDTVSQLADQGSLCQLQSWGNRIIGNFSQARPKGGYGDLREDGRLGLEPELHIQALTQ